MRCVFLLVMVLAVAVPMLAEDSGPVPVTESAPFDLLKRPDMPFDISRFRLYRDSAVRIYGDRQNLIPETAPVCYTMRTYVVKREEPQSDVTRAVGSTSCEWSSKFRVKSAGMEGR